MRRNVLTGLILCAGISTLMSTVSAQGMPGMGAGGMGGVAADPFTGYYSWFLPRQAAQSA